VKGKRRREGERRRVDRASPGTADKTKTKKEPRGYSLREDTRYV
jgi:hypothetical protein